MIDQFDCSRRPSYVKPPIFSCMTLDKVFSNDDMILFSLMDRKKS